MRLFEADLGAVATAPKPHPSGPQGSFPDAGDSCLTRVSAGVEDVSRIRRVARDFLAGLPVQSATREDALLVISELVTNAVTHALPPAALRLCRTPRSTLRIEVTDGGPQLRTPPRTDPMEEHGRGMQIVAALATHHGTVTHEQGATRWVELPL
ncbi:ATP-binding protein [Streptomyces sp. NPDC093568]|uniref:ATP-binding protein n=1 Tax=Streptomyces sp. NPDC093568 TaxID=3366041 RepID=UPI00382A63D3